MESGDLEKKKSVRRIKSVLEFRPLESSQGGSWGVDVSKRVDP